MSASADWAGWVDYAKQRRAAGASDATVMLELAQRGASSDEAEGVVRTLGARFDLSPEEQEALAAQKRRARGLLLAGVVMVVAGVGLLGLGGAMAFGGGQFALFTGGLIAGGLFLVGKNVGTT